MNPLRWMRLLSTRAHLALGLAGLAMVVVLSASLVGLLPDEEQATRRHRVALAETLALTTSGLMTGGSRETLEATLVEVIARNPGLLAVAVRDDDGARLLAVGAGADSDTEAIEGDALLRVPLFYDGAPWGRLELHFEALRAPGWVGHLQDPSLALAGFVFVCCVFGFTLYLRRMLRELDPKRAIPPRVRDAYDTLAEGLLVLDGKGRIVLANASTASMLGLEAPRLIGRDPSAFGWTGADGVPLAADSLPWRTARRSKKPQRDVHMHITAAGGISYALRANCSPLLDDRGGLQALVVSFQDVTELERRGQALRVAKEQADAANEAKSQFLANMSHEIRTPMNAILGFTEVLRRSPLRRSGDAAKHLDIIHASGHHLLRLIDDILDLSKVESGRLMTERIPFAPHDVVREVIETLAERASSKGLSLTLQVDTPLPATIAGDPARTRQILTNLVGNALKFTEQGGVTVALRLQRQGAATQCVIDVRDTGIGIAPDQLETVFEPFMQAEASTTRRFGGTGLGLTISRGFARAMGGDIEVRSAVGVGTTFSLHLDAGDAAAATMLEPETILRGVRTEATAETMRWQFPPACVLVVDDATHNRELLRLLLEEVGLTVVEADNGLTAIERIDAGGVDLVLMDMQMPVMDGSTATRTLRQRGCITPIVALTANAMKGFERELDEAGFSGHQTKPIERDRLLRALGPMLGGQLVATPPADAMPTEAAPLADVDDDAPIVSRLAGKPRLARIVASFVGELPQRMQRMDEALAGGDAATLAQLAHWLKGSGGSMGLDELHAPACRLEEAAHAGNLAQAGRVLQTLHTIVRRIQRGAHAPHATLESGAP